MNPRGNGTFLILFASLLVFVGLLGAYSQFVLFDADGFADRSLDALDDPALQREISEPLQLELTAMGAGPSSLGSAPDAITRGLISNPAFRRAFAAAVAGAHREIFDRDDDRPGVTVEDIDDPLRDQLEQVSSGSGGIVPDGLDLRLGSTEGAGRAVDVARTADSVTAIGAILALVGMALIGIAIWRASDRIASGRLACVGLALAGLGLVTSYLTGRVLVEVAIDGDEASEVAKVIYNAVAGDLLWLGALVTGAGFLAAIGLSLVRPRGPAVPAHAAETVQLPRPPAR